MTLREIDANIKKWTDRKVWITKCQLEVEVERLRNENEELKKQADFQNKLPFRFSGTIYEVEREYVLAVLSGLNNNKVQAADVLGITVKSLYNKLSEYDLFVEKKKATL